MSNGGHPFDALTPSRVLDAVEAYGFTCDGRLMALNSYENRVYQVGVGEQGYVVAKFYRPNRWSDAAIGEEHSFALALAAEDIPVVPPLLLERAEPERSLLRMDGFSLALYPKVAGRAPEFESDAHLAWLGRLLARIHAVGALTPFEQRGELDAESYGARALTALGDSGQVPEEVAPAYFAAARDAVSAARDALSAVGGYRRIRLHGDFHPGNILWGSEGPLIVDLDDARMGPAVQDLWMLLSGNRDERSAQLAAVLEGYSQFRDLDPLELRLIEPLRTLRLVRYAAWLARRWDDPAFPLAFPWFKSPRWWEDQTQTLKEQLDQMREPPLDPERVSGSAEDPE